MKAGQEYTHPANGGQVHAIRRVEGQETPNRSTEVLGNSFHRELQQRFDVASDDLGEDGLGVLLIHEETLVPEDLGNHDSCVEAVLGRRGPAIPRIVCAALTQGDHLHSIREVVGSSRCS